MATAATVRISCDWVDEHGEKCMEIAQFEVGDTSQARDKARSEGWGFLVRKYSYGRDSVNRSFCPRHELIFTANAGYRPETEHNEYPATRKRYWLPKK